MALTPKTPETDTGIEARQQYLALAREIIGDPSMDYTTLYQRFAENDWAAIKLDDEVAQRALKGGQAPKTVVGILYQSPYMQHQVHHNRVPIPPMHQYARSTVWMAMQKTGIGIKGKGQGQVQPRQRQVDLEME
jgi:hypothetical protein